MSLASAPSQQTIRTACPSGGPMPSPFLVLLTSTLLTSSAMPATPADDSTAVVQSQAGSQLDPGSPGSSTERPHEVGLGGFGGSGNGASFRYFMNDRVGVDLNVGWTLPSMGGSRQSGNGSATFRVAPSAMFMLTKSNKLADLDVRPYVGAGMN